MIDGDESPEVHWDIDRNIDAHAGAKRSPAIVITALTPIDPRWSPFVVGDPTPTIAVVVIPATIVKRSPSPIVVGYPCIAVVCHGPVTIGGIGLKIRPSVRNPDIAIVWIVDPLSIRRKFVVEHLKRDPRIVVVITYIAASLGH